MKKIRLFATLLAVALFTTTVFTSCGDDDDNGNGNGVNAANITATNVIGTTTEIATAKAVVTDYDSETDTEFYEIIAQAPFQNGGFTLQLTSPPSIFLQPFNVGEDFTVSDNEARAAGVELLAYDNAGNTIGLFYFANFEWRSDERPDVLNSAFWVYADRNVTLTGEARDDDAWGGMEYVWIDNWNVSLRQGWNIIYDITTITTEGNVQTTTTTHTSQRPAGANLSWRVQLWSDPWASPSATTRVTESRSSIFRR